MSARRSKRVRNGLRRERPGGSGLCFSAWLAQGFCMELLRVAYCRAFDSRQLRQCEIDKAFFFHHRYDLSWSWCLKEFAQMFPCQLSQNRANKKPGWNMPAFQRAMVHQHSEPHVLHIEKVIEVRSAETELTLHCFTALSLPSSDISNARRYPGTAIDSNSELSRPNDYEHAISKLERIHHEAFDAFLPTAVSTNNDYLRLHLTRHHTRSDIRTRISSFYMCSQCSSHC